MEVVVKTGAISGTKLQDHQPTNTQYFTGRMPFLSTNQHWQSTEGKYYFIVLIQPLAPI